MIIVLILMLHFCISRGVTVLEISISSAEEQSIEGIHHSAFDRLRT